MTGPNAGRITARKLSKSYQGSTGRLKILEEVDFDLVAGEAAAILGPSGSGKSTFLHLLGGLDSPDSGEVYVDGIDPYLLDETARAKFRNETVGFIFQDHHLLPQCSVLENVLIPTVPLTGATPTLVERARKLLERVGLTERLDHRPAFLSGGERQRAAVARAMINSPRTLLCDEPTGNLDRRNAESIVNLLLELCETERTAVVVVTHSWELAERLPRRFELRDYKLIDLHLAGETNGAAPNSHRSTAPSSKV